MQVLETRNKSAQDIMSLDAKLLDQLKAQDKPILHFYDWQGPSLTYGYFITLDKYLDLKKLKDKGIEAARRPTGGGIIFHLWDLAFSFLMPAGHKDFFENPLENYRFVHQIVLKALKSLEINIQKILYSLKEKCQEKLVLVPAKAELKLIEKAQSPLAFCMARPSKYDLVFYNKKAAGAAQRKKKSGYLHQGSIALVMPDEKLLFELLKDPKLAQAIIEESFFFSDDMQNLEKMRAELRKLLLYQFEKTLR